MATRFRTTLSGSQFFNDVFQRALSHWNHDRLAPQFPGAAVGGRIDRDARMMRLELGFIEDLRAEVIDEAAAAPTDADGFIAWFEALEENGPGQHDRLFDWLEADADVDELKIFLTQEAAGEAGFDDLVAMTQVRLPVRPKMELARNYWDEMGRGNPKGMHGPMLDYVVDALELTPTIETTCWESLALANAMTAMAANRSYAWHSVGALGAIELTAPARAAAVSRTMRRLGFDAKLRRYFDLHAVLDIKHSEEWNKEAIRPAVEDKAEGPARARAMAEGALMRLKCGERCFSRYREMLGVA